MSAKLVVRASSAATPRAGHGVASAYTRSKFSRHAQYPRALEPLSGHRVVPVIHTTERCARTRFEDLETIVHATILLHFPDPEQTCAPS